MTSSPVRMSLVIGTLALSVALYVASFFLPAFNITESRPNFPLNGWFLFLFGWIGVFDWRKMGFGSIAWFANLILFATWAGMALSGLPSALSAFPQSQKRMVSVVGLFASMLGVGAALLSLAIRLVLVGVSFEGFGDTYSTVTSMGSGFYVWFASFAVCLLGNAATTWSNFRTQETQIIVTESALPGPALEKITKAGDPSAEGNATQLAGDESPPHYEEDPSTERQRRRQAFMSLSFGAGGALLFLLAYRINAMLMKRAGTPLPGRTGLSPWPLRLSILCLLCGVLAMALGVLVLRRDTRARPSTTIALIGLSLGGLVTFYWVFFIGMSWLL